MSETIMLELKEAFTSDETAGEQERASCREEQASDDFPPALLSYFETSKARAALCEKLILEELEDFTPSDCTENMTSLSKELSEDMVKLNEQVSGETENEENKIDGCPLQTPANTQTPLTHNVTVCPGNEDGAGIDLYMENEKYLPLDINKYELEKEKHNSEEMHKKDERQQREMNFQEELRKIMEAEKLHQKKLEMLQKRAQEKLEQELLLQQELIGNLQKQVEQERRMIEEEKKRKKEEEKRKIKEMQKKSKTEEEDKSKMKEDNKMKTEKEQERKILEERKRLGEEENMVKLRLKEEKKQEDLWKMQEARRNTEEEKIRKKEEERKMEVIQLKEEEKRGEKQEVEEKKERKKNGKSEDKERKEDEKNMMEAAGSKVTEDQKRQNEEIISIKEGKKRNNKDEDEKPREEVVRLSNENKIKRKQEQVERNEVQAENEEEKEKGEAKKKMVNEDMGRKDENTRRKDDKMQLKGSDEKEKEHVETMETQDMIREDKKTKIKAEELIKRGKEEMRQSEEQERRNADEEIKLKLEMWGNKEREADTKMEHERKPKDKAKRQEEVKKRQEEDGIGKKEDGVGNKEDAGHYQKGHKENIQTEEGKVAERRKEGVISKNELLEKKRENSSMKSQNENTGGTESSRASQPGGTTTWTSSSPDPLHNDSTASPICSKTAEQQDLDKNISQISIYKTNNQQDPAKPGTSCSLPASLPEHTEQKRLLWMKDCIPWSKLSLQNRRKQKGSVRSKRGPRRAAEGSSLPPLCPHTLLQSAGWKSLHEVTTVTLEDLPGCSLITLAQCTQLRSLSLRRCGIKSLGGISHLQQLWYIDLQENDISFVDCENMGSLRVLQLGHNKLTSIHGLSGAENLDILDLSHNSITRIAGLESVRRLQRLSVDHNQLISTKGLRDVYTLLHLDCSHNHLASVEGLESSALLHTLDLRGNSLSEPPSLNNQVLLRELHLDDNSISSLHGLTACWLPLMQHLSAAQNRITQLPSMSDFVSLENLDLRYNCLSELQNVCENLEGCQFLREIHLTGNPLQLESGWRSTLQKSVPGLRAIDSQQTDSFFLPPAVQQVSLASGCFLTFCQLQLQQTHDLQQRHSRELSKASYPFDDVESFCRHFTVTLKLAEDQRFAHEYGDTTGSDELWAVSQTAPEKTLDNVIAEKLTDYQEIESANKIPPVFLNKDNMRCSYWNFEEIPATKSHSDTFGPKEDPAASFNDEKASASSHQDLNLKNAAAVMIQQCWRKYKQKCGNIIAPPITEKGGERGGDGREPEPRPCCINRSAAGKDYAATVIQAFWRGCTLRRRLTSALAAVTCPSAGEDDTFEEVDIDEFVFDEAALEEHCRLMLSQDSPRRYHPVSEQPSSLKFAGPCLDPFQDLLSLPKQAWAAGEHVDSAAKRFSAETSNRSTSPASTSVLSGLSERSEKILEEWGFTDSRTALLMLRRARKMKSKRQLQKKHGDPSVRLALFRKCNYQLTPVEARDRTGQYNRNYGKVAGAAPGHQQAERTEQVQQAQTQQWLHSQASRSHGQSESDHFLPDIDSSILNGGRVQLVVNPAYADCLHHTSGLWPNSSLAAQGCKLNSYDCRSSSGHIRKEVPSPIRVTSAPSKKDRISFRDSQVQLSGGWGGGKKRVRK